MMRKKTNISSICPFMFIHNNQKKKIKSQGKMKLKWQKTQFLPPNKAVIMIFFFKFLKTLDLQS